MPSLKIKIYGDPTLRKVCSPIETIGEETEQLAFDMVETMYEKNGVGNIWKLFFYYLCFLC